MSKICTILSGIFSALLLTLNCVFIHNFIFGILGIIFLAINVCFEKKLFKNEERNPTTLFIIAIFFAAIVCGLIMYIRSDIRAAQYGTIVGANNVRVCEQIIYILKATKKRGYNK